MLALCWRRVYFQLLCQTCGLTIAHTYESDYGDGWTALERLNNQEIDIVLAPSKLNSNQDMLIQEIMLEDEIGIYAGKISNLIGLNRNITREELSRQSWMVVGARSNIYEEEYEHFSTLDYQI